jgi:hypothetical protein
VVLRESRMAVERRELAVESGTPAGCCRPEAATRRQADRSFVPSPHGLPATRAVTGRRRIIER